MINGPNLNSLGTREPSIYGSATLADVVNAASTQCSKASVTFTHFQSNHEGQIIDKIHAAKADGVSGIVINPGAYTHTSIAIRDAFQSVHIPFVEIHISNIHKREAFRHHSYLSDIAAAVIVGCGVVGYKYALDFCIEHVKSKEKL